MVSERSEPDIRRVVGALANDDARRVYAEAVLAGFDGDAGPLGQRRRERALAALAAAGLIDEKGAATAGPFREILSRSGRRSAESGIARFVQEGRIHSLPASSKDRLDLLAWLRDSVIEPNITLSEPELNERLRVHHDDVALLRRYLVDEGLLERTATGSSYRRKTTTVENSTTP